MAKKKILLQLKNIELCVDCNGGLKTMACFRGKKGHTSRHKLCLARGPALRENCKIASTVAKGPALEVHREKYELGLKQKP